MSHLICICQLQDSYKHKNKTSYNIQIDRKFIYKKIIKRTTYRNAFEMSSSTKTRLHKHQSTNLQSHYFIASMGDEQLEWVKTSLTVLTDSYNIASKIRHGHGCPPLKPAGPGISE